MHSAKADPSLLQSARNSEGNGSDKFNQTLFAALDALEEDKIPYALIGGVASHGLGRPRTTHDIDVFVRPEDSGVALAALARKGFQTEKTDLSWLFKGFKDEVLVDVIFKSRGDIYFDAEMEERSKPIIYHGRKVKTVSPEDLIIIKCTVHDEIGPHHWHDALAVLSHAALDWDYLLKRARRAPRRLLALLLYAQSNDIWVPNRSIFELFRVIFGDSILTGVYAPSPVISVPGPAPSRRVPEQYLAAQIKDALVRDSRTGDQDVRVRVEGNRVLLRGEVASQEHRKAIEEVVRDQAPSYQIENQINVSVLTEPESAEEVG
ncbi:MAG: nucleotidyltransferase [Deltaproteobacteria bacterium]|nr:nucleotidyltransferase [Deltaproteobacteria bacterium]